MAMAPAAQQIANLLSMLFMMTSLGIPLSMPPGQEDPFLSQIAPERCIYYSRWAGIAQPEADSENQIDQLFREEEVQHFLKEFDDRTRRAVDFMVRQGNGAEAVFPEVAATLGRLVLTQPTLIFVSDVRATPPGLDGGAVIKLGDHQEEIEKILVQLQAAIPPEAATQLEIDGAPFLQLNVPNGNTVTWGIHDGYLMFGVGDDAIRKILERSKTPAPNWLQQIQAENDLPRRATFTYADLGCFHSGRPSDGRRRRT